MLHKIKYQPFLILSNFAWFIYFVPNFLCRIVDSFWTLNIWKILVEFFLKKPNLKSWTVFAITIFLWNFVLFGKGTIRNYFPALTWNKSMSFLTQSLINEIIRWQNTGIKKTLKRSLLERNICSVSDRLPFTTPPCSFSYSHHCIIQHLSSVQQNWNHLLNYVQGSTAGKMGTQYQQFS